MAKGIKTCIGGVVRNVPLCYTEVGGVTRKIQKGYVGIGGVVRQFYAGNVIYENGSEGYSLVAASSRTDGFGCYAEKKEDRIALIVHGNATGSSSMSYGYGGVYTKEAIDLTNYAEIQVTFLCKKNLTTFPTRHYLYVGVDSDMADITTFDKSKKKYLYDSDDTDGDGNKYLNSVGGSYTMSLDVSSLSGAYYIKAGAYAGHYYKNAYEEFRAVTKIELIE